MSLQSGQGAGRTIAAIDSTTELVCLDRRLADLATLTAGIRSTVTVQTVDPGVDRLVDLLAAWGELPQLETLHLMAHGAPGALYLGQDGLNLANVDDVATVLRNVAPNLQSIALWGCNVAAGDAGSELLDRLHQLTGASVAASVDRLGAGFWALESQRGSPEVVAPIDRATQRSYAGTFPCVIVGGGPPPAPYIYDCPPGEGGGASASSETPPPPPGVEVYPLSEKRLIPDGTTTEEPIAQSLAGINGLSQKFDIVNNGGSLLKTSDFSVSLFGKLKGGLSVGNVFQVIDPSTGKVPSLDIQGGDRRPIVIALQTKLPDGTPMPAGTYRGNFGFQTNAPTGYYNFPIAGTIAPTSAETFLAAAVSADPALSSVSSLLQKDTGAASVSASQAPDQTNVVPVKVDPIGLTQK